jgi:hypothetical protein
MKISRETSIFTTIESAHVIVFVHLVGLIFAVELWLMGLATRGRPAMELTDRRQSG